jgi:glycosyltransferase involved in cell wall biosynthesis
VLALPGETPPPELAARFAVLPLAAAADEGRLALYQMGNNRYHLEVERRALAVPGVVVLHDLVLHHLLLERTVGRVPPDLASYEAELAAEHGWIGERVARAKRWSGYAEIVPFLLPAHRRLVRAQRGVLVHSRWSAARVAEEQPEVRVAAVPMAVPLPPLPDAAARAAVRARLGVAEGALLLGSFGFQTPIKRTDVAIRALAAPELAGVHLLVGGEPSPGLDLLGQARELGVAERVHLLGYLPFREMEEAIAATDLCLNLRYPSAGETSASLLRILALGRAALVSDHAQFAELPDAVVVKVPLERERELPALRAALAALGADPARLAALGAAARRHVAQQHDPAAAARAVAARCLEWSQLAPPAASAFASGARDADAAAAEPPPATTLSARELRAALRVEGAGRPWLPGERRRLRIVLENSGTARWLAAARGDGGVALEVRLETEDGRDLRRAEPWLALPRDLAPGERCALELAVRRPPGGATLRVVPHVAGRGSFAALGGDGGGEWASTL